MKKFILISFLLFLAGNICGQDKVNIDHAESKLNCKVCHTCDTPTKSNPCLVKCPRNLIVTTHNSPKDAPEIIIIDQFKGVSDLFGPVNFPHKAHAEMSEMDGGCSSCHHYTPNGKITPCNDCHTLDRETSSISRPDLKAAYHRECLGCHREWSGSNNCNSCHTSKSSAEKNGIVKIKPAPEKFQSNIKTPGKIVFHTDNDDEPIVTFFHSDHTKMFGLQCGDCHKETTCADCHNAAKSKKGLASMNSDDPHDKCSSCHDTDDNCGFCHSTKEEKSFNHLKKTGFALGKFHKNISCEVCHGKGKEFKKPSKSCNSCHGKWNDDNFNHSVTGFELSEPHDEFYCENCHINRNFAGKPNCAECHDNDISFPNNLPGKYIKRKIK
ncbi:MAG: hypothetical protein GXO87_03775 [Chlorobi bacterium]|nr:hypothetical protein [Chlorobiota bacterium]